MAQAWERFDQVAEQFIDLGENGVLVIFRTNARGRVSGVELAQRLAVHVRLKLAKLADLKKQAVLTEAEFEAEKAKILGES